MSLFSLIIFNLFVFIQTFPKFHRKPKFDREAFDMEIDKILYYQSNLSEITIPTELFIELVHRSRTSKRPKFEKHYEHSLFSVCICMFFMGIIISSIIILIYCLCKKFKKEKLSLIENIRLSQQIEMNRFSLNQSGNN